VTPVRLEHKNDNYLS